jgi:putative membrane protein
MMWGWNDAGWAGWLLMTLMMLVFWGGLAAIVVWLIRQPQRSGGDSKPSATAILEERFARGEIDEEEFQKRLDTLLQASGRKR